MITKKAFEIQFNWLFVLVAGAAILLFFASIVVKQKNISEASLRATIQKGIDSIIAGASISTDTTDQVPIPNSNIEVSCGKISIGGASKQYQNLILFAPSVIKGDKLIWQTMAFNAPYRATNLLYITSPQLMYIIIGNNNLAKDINKSLSFHLNKEFYETTPAIKNFNNYKVRFIVFDNMIYFPKALEKMPDADVTALKISGNNEKGTIKFYQKSESSWVLIGVSYYLTEQSLIGAIYADTLQAYNCNMQNTFSKLNLVTKVYSERTKRLKSGLSGIQTRCEQIYDNALAHLASIEAASKFEQGNIDKIDAYAKLLAEENKNAQKNSCPLIY